jgi:hypothetical protein
MLMLCWISADAQYNRMYKTYEIHVGVGAANVFGDLGGAATRDNWGGLKDLQFSQTRPTFYVAGRTYLNEQFSVKLGLFAGLTAGSDKGSYNDYRAYSYSGKLVELSGQMEWNFLRANVSLGSMRLQRRGLRGARLQTHAYAFLGAGAAYSITTLNTNGKKLGTGEYDNGSPAGLVVPFGLGVKSDINQEWAIGFEIGRRYSTSDYLDGITTDWSKDNDLYYFTTLHAIYKFNVSARRRPSRRR